MDLRTLWLGSRWRWRWCEWRLLVLMLIMMLFVVLERMLVLVLGLGMRWLLLQLLDALFDVIWRIRINLTFGLRVDGLSKLAELAELQLFLLRRVQQLLLAWSRVQRVMLLAVRLRIAGHLVVHAGGFHLSLAAELWAVSLYRTAYVRVATRAIAP